MPDLPVIYLIAEPEPLFGEIRATAMTADGVVLAWRDYTCESKARYRLANAHGLYRKAYPDGYRLVWSTEDPDGFATARVRNKEQWKADQPAREAEYAETMRVRAELQRVQREQLREWAEDPKSVEEERIYAELEASWKESEGSHSYPPTEWGEEPEQ